MELYRSNTGLMLEVTRLANGRIMVKSKAETKSFENYKQLATYLYNKGFHILMTDRRSMPGYRFEDTEALALQVPYLELAFRKDGNIYTGWFTQFKPSGFVELKCNADFAYTNNLGYKAVTVKLEELILIQGGIQ